MIVNDELIEKLAHLARLQIQPEERESLKHDFEKMVAFIEKLNELDTTGVEPLLFMTDEVNVLRDDVVVPSISRDEALLNAPAKSDAFFKVPKVIKK